ncbi:MAG: DUF934 domain-containing protein [Alphaproteobacteria bacterium]|nr:DUF934 domain-containing protein [Alphaproteobacteria bacterium]
MSMLLTPAGPVAHDPWRILADDEPAPGAGDVAVSFARVRDDPTLLRRAGRLGVTIAPADRVEDIADKLGALALIAVAFPAFRDGRGYSTARLVRERYGYKGELRAVGDVLEDQLFFMLRCGFHSFAVTAPDPEAAMARAVRRFSLAYQSAGDALIPIHQLRAMRRAQRTAAE